MVITMPVKKPENAPVNIASRVGKLKRKRISVATIPETIKAVKKIAVIFFIVIMLS